MANEKWLELSKKYCEGNLTKEDLLKELKSSQNIAKYLKRLGFSYKSHVMTSKGFISKDNLLWKAEHTKYLRNEKSYIEIGSAYGLQGEYIRVLFENLGFSKKSEDAIKKAAELTCLKKYGVKNPSQAEAVKKRKIETTLKNYGVENPFQNEEVKEKIRKTTFDNHGVDNVLKLKDIHNKGVEKAQSEEACAKRVQTNLERYDTAHPFANPEVKEKIKKTLQRKYKCDNPMESEEIKNKLKENNIKKYGVPYVMQNEEIKIRSITKKLEIKNQKK